MNGVWVPVLPGPLHLGLKTGPLCPVCMCVCVCVCVTAEIELQDIQKSRNVKKRAGGGGEKEKNERKRGTQIPTLVPNPLPHLIHLMRGTIQLGYHVVDLHSCYCASLMWVYCIHQAAL